MFCNSVANILKNEQIAKGNKSIDNRVESNRYPVIGSQ